MTTTRSGPAKAVEARTLNRRHAIGLVLAAGASAAPALRSAEAKHRGKKKRPPYVFAREWPVEDSPHALAMSGDGALHAASGDQVHVYSPTGAPIWTWGGSGSGPGQFFGIGGLAIAASGVIYATDLNAHRVQKFSPTGEFLATWGERGEGNGQFQFPLGIAVDGNGNVYVGDTDNHRIQKFDADGTWLTAWGTRGNGDGQFSEFCKLAVDGSARVYLLDQENCRVQVFSADGTFIRAWRSDDGKGPPDIYSSEGIAVTPDGTVFVSDFRDDNDQQMKMLDAGGKLVGSWHPTGSGSQGNWSVGTGLALDASQNLYVADSGIDRIVVFSPRS